MIIKKIYRLRIKIRIIYLGHFNLRYRFKNIKWRDITKKDILSIKIVLSSYSYNDCMYYIVQRKYEKMIEFRFLIIINYKILNDIKLLII